MIGWFTMSSDQAPAATGLRSFYAVLANTALANVTTNYLWFALTFWLYLETRSVLATSVVGGSYMLLLAVLGVPFGMLVDRHRKKRVMVIASLISLVAYVMALGWYLIRPAAELTTIGSPGFIVFVLLVLGGSVVESMRGLALSTCVTLLVPDGRRDRANGLVGMVLGLSFAVTSVFSGLSVGQLGMFVTVVGSVLLTGLSLAHLFTVRIPEPEVAHAEGVPQKVDFAGAWEAILGTPGLLGLIVFATFNNLLGGVFIALMDPYGLNLVSVEVWGVLWGVLSFGFLIGSGVVAARGLGARPLRVLLLANLAMWAIGIVFTIRESIWLMAGGILVYMALIPVAEAAEQTVLQRVVPYAKQGRVFGFAQSVEVAAAPITAFVVGPVAQFWLIPYMASPQGRATFGWLLGEGTARGLALVFVLSGVAGLAITLLAFASRSYRLLTAGYDAAAPEDVEEDGGSSEPLDTGSSPPMEPRAHSGGGLVRPTQAADPAERGTGPPGPPGDVAGTGAAEPPGK